MDIGDIAKHIGLCCTIQPSEKRYRGNPRALLATNDQWKIERFHDGVVWVIDTDIHTLHSFSLEDIKEILPTGGGTGLLRLHVQVVIVDGEVSAEPLSPDYYDSGGAPTLFAARDRHTDGPFPSFPDHWVEFVTAYMIAARRLSKEAVGDISSMPMVFLYRQAIELGIKVILARFGNRAEYPKLFRSHDLKIYWDEVKALAHPLHMDQRLDEIQNFVTLFQENDPKSDAARFPFDRDGNPSAIANRESYHARLFVKQCEDTLEVLRDLYQALADAHYHDTLKEIIGELN